MTLQFLRSWRSRPFQKRRLAIEMKNRRQRIPTIRAQIPTFQADFRWARPERHGNLIPNGTLVAYPFVETIHCGSGRRGEP
ncbi:hypothetical protein CKO51_21580 [Rhodopirellula sp. SM50]|nr:hypothetical protein CKO51_21580 [Rhodopirellula sp. SM50]